MGKEDDAFLLVGVGAGDDGGDGFGGAGVVGQVGHVGGDVEVVAGADDGVVLELLAVPDARDAAEGVDGGFVGLVFVCFGFGERRDGDDLEMNAGGACGFSRDAGFVEEALLALKFGMIDIAGGNEAAGGECGSDGFGHKCSWVSREGNFASMVVDWARIVDWFG